MLKKHQKLTLEGQDMLTKKKIHKLVDYSIKKYGKAYKKLEKYNHAKTAKEGFGALNDLIVIGENQLKDLRADTRKK